MSTITGVLRLDNSRKINENLIYTMLDISVNDSDRTLTAHNNSNEVFMGNSLLHTTPFSADQDIKYTIFNKDFFIAYDGRLNDREELARKLAMHADKMCDAQLILYSYIKWGEGFLKELDGDFAFSIWDEYNKTLILARDRLGLKSLFYSFKNNLMIWGSSIKQIVKSSLDRKYNLNKDFLFKYLIDAPYAKSETAFIDITRVEPGQCLIVKNGSLHSYQYYTCEPQKIRYKQESDYIERFYELFEKSVRNTLNTNQPVGVALSGGLDSSSIVSLGYHINQLIDFRSYSYTFDEYEMGNEDSYIQSLSNMYPIKTTFIKADDLWYFKGDFSQIIGELDEPYAFFNDAFMGEIANRLKKEGVKVLLSGIYGDHVLAGNPNNLAILLKTLKLYTLFQECRGWVNDERKLKNVLWDWSIKPLFNNNKRVIPPWLNTDIVKNEIYNEVINDTSILNNYWDEEGLRRYAKKLMYGIGAEWDNNFMKSKGVELRLPFFNYKLIEYMLGIPENLRMKPGPCTKYILRQALKGIMPEKIRTRNTKGNHEYLIHKGFKKEWEQINSYSDFRMLKGLGFLNENYNYQQHFDKYYAGLTVEKNLNWAGLMRALSLEVWLRSKLLKGGE